MADNLSILQAVKQSIAEAAKKMTFNFKDGLDESKLRCPNLVEQKNWLLNNLRELLFNCEITTQQYRSIKREIRKGHFDVVFNFMIKRGIDDIKERFQEYSSSKIMYDKKVKVTFPEPVQVCMIDIKVEKGGN